MECVIGPCRGRALGGEAWYRRRHAHGSSPRWARHRLHRGNSARLRPHHASLLRGHLRAGLLRLGWEVSVGDELHLRAERLVLLDVLGVRVVRDGHLPKRQRRRGNGGRQRGWRERDGRRLELVGVQRVPDDVLQRLLSEGDRLRLVSGLGDGRLPGPSPTAVRLLRSWLPDHQHRALGASRRYRIRRRGGSTMSDRRRGVPMRGLEQPQRRVRQFSSSSRSNEWSVLHLDGLCRLQVELQWRALLPSLHRGRQPRRRLQTGRDLQRALLVH